MEVFICKRSGLFEPEERDVGAVRETIAGKREDRIFSFSERGMGGSS
jgi:hypothetical protein